MTDTGMNFGQHLYSSRILASPVCLKSWGARGCSPEAGCTEHIAHTQPWIHRCWDATSWILLAPAEGRPKGHFLSVQWSHSSWRPEREWTWMSSSHCTKKEDSPRVSGPALPLSHCKGQVLLCRSCRASPWAGSVQLCSASHLSPKQHKVSWLMPCITPEVKLSRKRLPIQLGLGTS